MHPLTVVTKSQVIMIVKTPGFVKKNFKQKNFKLKMEENNHVYASKRRVSDGFCRRFGDNLFRGQVFDHYVLKFLAHNRFGQETVHSFL